jgi:hypothetical protein
MVLRPAGAVEVPKVRGSVHPVVNHPTATVHAPKTGCGNHGHGKMHCTRWRHHRKHETKRDKEWPRDARCERDRSQRRDEDWPRGPECERDRQRDGDEWRRWAWSEEWRRSRRDDWHGCGWWRRTEWWRKEVQPYVGSTLGEPGAIRPTLDGAAVAALEGMDPGGRLKITNRKTGVAVVAGERFRMAGADGCYKIVASNSGYYFLHRERPRQSDGAARAAAQAQDAASRPVMWKAVPVEKGYWKLVNCESGKFLEDGGADGALGESPARDGAVEQQWRLDPTPD